MYTIYSLYETTIKMISNTVFDAYRYHQGQSVIVEEVYLWHFQLFAAKKGPSEVIRRGRNFILNKLALKSNSLYG